MLRPLARIFIALLVAVLVPLQGLAAAQGDLCMGVGHQHSHDGDQGADHHPGGHDDGKSAAHCPPCVACCGAAAISGSAAIAIPADGVHAQAGTAAPLRPGVQPGTLDRPPLPL